MVFQTTHSFILMLQCSFLSTAMSENLVLRQKLTLLEDELENAVAFKSSLEEDLMRERVLRADREKLSQRNQELQRELSLSQHKSSEMKEEIAILLKLKDELDTAETQIATLNEQLSDLSLKNERAELAMSQIEEYRSQLREHAKIGRDQKIYVHKLEAQVNELQYYKARNEEMMDEIDMYKHKMEKIPALLAETARLRACNKTVFKALLEYGESSLLKTREKYIVCH